MPKETDLSNDILSNFINDDEDQDQLGSANEPTDDFDDNDPDDSDDDGADGSRRADDARDDDDDDGVRRPTGDVGDDETNKQDRFSFKEDRAGNFVDRDGKIIIRAGKQRDLFVKLKKRWLSEEKKNKQIASRFSETVQAAQQLLERYKALKAERTEFDGRGLTAAEKRTAADMAVMMKVDPKAAVRKILTMLHMNGTDLKDIGVTGPVDAAEVARIMAERTQPKQKTAEEQAREEANAFLNRHPAARQYTGLVAQAKRKFPHMSLDEIWFQLIVHARERKAKANGNAGGNTNTNRQPDRVSPRNGTRGSERSPVKGKKLSLAAVDPSQSFNQIGRDLLRDLKEIEGN